MEKELEKLMVLQEDAKKVRIPWNKGLTNIYSSESLEKMSNSKLGKKMSESFKEKRRKHMTGSKQSPELIAKRVNSRKGYRHSEETRKILSERKIHNPAKVFKDTKIELKIENELIKRGINYQKQVPLCKIAIVDFYLPEHRIVIQADGCYWHNCPIHSNKKLPGKTEKSENQDRGLSFNGFNVYRFWEHDINKSVEDCIDQLNIC